MQSFSVVVVDKKNELELKQFIVFLNEVIKDSYEIIYCSGKSITESEYIKNFVFDVNENPEKIINSVISECSAKNIIVLRDVNQYKSIKILIKAHTKNNQIVFMQKKMGKFKRFWYGLVQKSVGWIFAQNLEPIDFSVVLYGEITSSVLTKIKSPSVLMKINRWTGIEFVNAGIGDAYKFGYKKVVPIFSTIVPFFTALFMIVLKVAVNFKISGGLMAIYIGIIATCLLFGAVFGFRWILKSILGDNILDKAKHK